MPQIENVTKSLNLSGPIASYLRAVNTGAREDFAASFEKLKTLPCDVFLASHAFMFNLEPKLAQWKANPQVNPFIDPQGCRDYVADWEYEFRYKLQQARLGQQPTG